MAFNILVVDDSLPMRRKIMKTIMASGFCEAEFVEASDGSEAMHILKDKLINIMMTGYNMPNMDGLELISGMKNDTILKSIPVVVITAECCQKRIMDFRDSGVAAVIMKPFKPEKIREKLYEVLKIAHHNAAYGTFYDAINIGVT